MRLINPTQARRRIARLCWGLLGAVIVTCSAACGSNKLTRSSAATLIESSEAFRKPVTISLLPEYRQTLALIGEGSRDMPKEEFALHRFLESHADLAALSHLGLVEFKVTGIQYPDSASSPVTITSSLTSKGSSAARQWQQSGEGWTIPIAKRELVEVTGLTGGEGESKQARVEYTWRWLPTEAGASFDVSGQAYQSLPASVRQNLGGASFGDMLRAAGQRLPFDSSKSQKGEATLQLYDDGWRVAGP
ncbi:MAG: hypothetical protein LC785_06040 [Acidobacteria bacterium]|nr:hypothetical protein [Acidobacteriota bacterium]MCA1641506.1 hypothetical protein [Acidobacteriota bacterium]